LRVALIDSPRHRDRLETLAKELGSIPFTADLGARTTWPDLLHRIEKDAGAPRAAALIAGGYSGGSAFWEGDDVAWDATWNAMMGGNLETAARTMRALLPGMVARKDGRIVVVGSRAVERPWTSAGSAAYAASKAALVALAQTIAAESLEHGVTINAVLPSTLDTPANRAAMPKADPSRWVPLAAAAKQIAFLLSDDARDVSGAAIPIYGRA
jgi:NAD(P)-dependent dehydrogenase (short-subunit alcohol dehydrogenase family)